MSDEDTRLGPEAVEGLEGFFMPRDVAHVLRFAALLGAFQLINRNLQGDTAGQKMVVAALDNLTYPKGCPVRLVMDKDQVTDTEKLVVLINDPKGEKVRKIKGLMAALNTASKLYEIRPIEG